MNRNQLRESIKRHEGYREAPYKDHLGNWTVGFGHLIHNVDLRPYMPVQTVGALLTRLSDADTHRRWLEEDINNAQESIARLNAEVQEISTDQSRIRQNMNNINRNTELYTRYLRKFDTQETRLEQIHELRETEQQRLDSLRLKLQDYLKNLNVA